MPHRPFALPALILAAAVGVGLSGCATVHDSTGRVSVTISSDAASGQRYLVKVKDAHGQTVEYERLAAGQSSDFAGVPLGKVTVSVADWCRISDELVTGEVLHFDLGPTGCSK